MKFNKLALATVAAFGLAGVAQADPTYYVEEGLELWGTMGGTDYTAPTRGANEYGKDGTAAVWFGGTAGDETAVVPYDGNVPANNKWPTKNGEGVTYGNNFLKVSNSSPLWRMLTSYGKVGPEGSQDWPTSFPAEEGTDVTVGSSGLYVDTLVQFTPSEDPPTPDSSADKLIVWMNTNGVLCVTAGKLKWEDGNDPAVELTHFVTTQPIQTNTWYRLTVSAFDNILQGEAVSELQWIVNGFEVRIDGNKVTVAAPQVVADEGFTAPADEQLDFDGGLIAMGAVKAQAADSITNNQFFGSLKVGSAATLAAVGFKGEGCVDNIFVSDLLPTFTSGASGIDFTLTWDADVSAVWYSIDGGTPLAATKDATVRVENAVANTTKIILTGTAADAWSFVAEVTNTLSDAQNAWTVTATAAAKAGSVGVTDPTIAEWSPDQVKAAFGNGVTPGQINGATNPYLDYQFGQSLNTLLAADPTLKIVDIAESATPGTWVIKIQVLNGGSALPLEDNGSSKLNATLLVKAAASLAALDGTPAAGFPISCDGTTTDLTITVNTGSFFKAEIVYGDPSVAD